MFESLIGIVALVAVIVVVARQHARIGLLEREVGALRSFVLAAPPAAAPAARAAEPAAVAEPTLLADTAPAGLRADEAGLPQDNATQADMAAVAPEADATDTAGPWAEPARVEAAAAAQSAKPPRPAVSRKPDTIETALGTRWAVWVGGVALALGGVFLIRYSIEAGLFGPAFRLSMAALLGIVLVAVGEYIRRTGYKLPVEGAAGAHVPAILTAAGAFTLFGTVYAAHALYDFIGPLTAFVLLGIIGLGTLAAALVHGQALAGVGLLGAMATPALVSSQSPNAWVLFGYLAVVLAANVAVARVRDWGLLAAAGFAGAGLWSLIYLAGATTPEIGVLVFTHAVSLATLGVLWLGRRSAEDQAGIDWPSVMPGFFVGLGSLALMVDPAFLQRGEIWGAVLVIALVAIAFVRPPAVPLLYAAGTATVIAHLRLAFGGSFAMDTVNGQWVINGLPAAPYSSVSLWIAVVLGVLLFGAGYFNAQRLVATLPRRAATWAAWGTLVPLAAVGSFWLAFGNIDRDFAYAAAALVLVLLYAAGAELIARAERPPLVGGLAVSFALAGAGVATVLMLHMAFGELWTTILIGAAAVIPALATLMRGYPALGWLCAGAAVMVIARAAVDPTIVGEMYLGKTPVLNALLPGYGVPALAFIFAAWQLARTTNGRPRLVMEAAGALFALLTVAMLVRHAMNGGVIDSSVPTLAEQAIYTLLALGSGAIFVSLDMRSPSSVLRYGSLAAGVVSVLLIVGQHFVMLNPLFTDESTGRIPVLNLLLLAYLLPAIAAGALALYTTGKRPSWYSAMLAGVSAALFFTYCTLSVRRLFQGEYIALWAGMGQLENYSYSALWLAMGVVLLVLGVWLKSHVLRIASAGLIAIAVAKVFIFDMSALEGVLRAFSFIGLGAVLIGIGLFYQKLLTEAARREAAAK